MDSTRFPPWRALDAHRFDSLGRRVRDVFRDDSSWLDRWGVRANDLLLD
jgi:hypothetical protein